MSGKPKYLTISNDLLIFRPDGNAPFFSKSGQDPETVEQEVYRWQRQNPDHPHFELAEQWVQAFHPPSRSEGLAEELGISGYQARNLLPGFKAAHRIISHISTISEEELRTILVKARLKQS